MTKQTKNNPKETDMIERIRRNASSRIAKIINNASGLKRFDLGSSFVGKDIDKGCTIDVLLNHCEDVDVSIRDGAPQPQVVKAAKLQRRRELSYDTERQRYMLHVHSNLWYEFE